MRRFLKAIIRPIYARLMPHENTSRFAYEGSRPETGRPPTEFEALFWDNTGVPVDKWHHYLPIYDRYFFPWKNRPLRMLEIGVSKGGSLTMWRKYFGADAIIFGVDIDPNCAKFNGKDGQVRIGSQDDPNFLKSVIDEMGGVDIILDDGSHIAKHMNASLNILFPLLANGGLYLVEDMHTSYWRRHGGGEGRAAGFTNTLKVLIDDMHHWYHRKGQKIVGTRDFLAVMHIHDSIVVMEKAIVPMPQHSVKGRPQ